MIMRIRFVRDLVAFGKPRCSGDVLEVPPQHPDTAVCLRSGWAVIDDGAAAVETQIIPRKTRVIRRKGAKR